MEKFYLDADKWHIGQNLLVLSLDVMQPELEKLKAPRLVEADYLALRRWAGFWPSFEFFPYAADIDFATTVQKLFAMLPPARGAELLDWALRSAPLIDPSRGQDADRPANAAKQWRNGLAKARDLNRLSVMDLSPDGHAALLTMLKDFDDRMAVADTLYKAFEKEWDPYPRDAKQKDYNLNCKSPWDRHIYQTYCQIMSFHLNFSVVSIMEDQEMHRFVRGYARSMPPADRANISAYLPLALEGQGHYQLHPWQLERLRTYADTPLEVLLPFTRDPV